MKINEILREDSNKGNLDQLISQIRNDCSEFLSNPTYLIRGVTLVHGQFQTIAKEPIRQDRKTLNKTHLGTAIFNEAFEQTFNFPRIRNRSLFVTNTDSVAKKYGELYFAIPTNGSKVAFIDGVPDSIGKVANSWFDFQDAIKTRLSKEERDAFIQQVMELNTPNFPEDWFDRLVNTLSEPNQEIADRAIEIIKERLMSNYTVTNIGSLKSSTVPTEYMIFDSNSYWMIHPEAISGNVHGSDNHAAWNELMKKLRT